MEVLNWRKSSYSGGNGGGCVEVAERPGVRHVRDSTHPAGGMLTVSAAEFAQLIDSIKADRLVR